MHVHVHVNICKYKDMHACVHTYITIAFHCIASHHTALRGITLHSRRMMYVYQVFVELHMQMLQLIDI